MGKTLPILLATAVLAGVSFSNPASAKNDACQAAANSAASDEYRLRGGLKDKRAVRTMMMGRIKKAVNDAGCKNPSVEVFIPKDGSSNAANRVRWHCEVSGPPFHANCSFGNI